MKKPQNRQDNLSLTDLMIYRFKLHTLTENQNNLLGIE